MSKYEFIILAVLAVVVLFVGGKKLPELARGVGEAGRELKSGFKGEDETKKKDSDNKIK